jgi:hypothetical protein
MWSDENKFNRVSCAFLPDLTYGEFHRFMEKDEDALWDLVWRHTEIRIAGYQGKRLPKHRYNKKRDKP